MNVSNSAFAKPKYDLIGHKNNQAYVLLSKEGAQVME
jgi:hypothetical protein